MGTERDEATRGHKMHIDVGGKTWPEEGRLERVGEMRKTEMGQING